MADTAAPEQATRAPRAAGSRPRGPRRDGEPRTERPRRERVDAPKNPDSLRVKADTRVKILAGAVAAKMRESGSVVVDAIGAPSVNQAVKSVIIARGYLEKDGMDIVLTAKTVPEVGPDAISISLAKNPDGRKAAEADAAEKAKGPEEPAKEPEGGPKEDGDAIVGSNGALRIAVGTKPQALAGAIAAFLRGNSSTPVTVTGIGPQAVLKGVKALSLVAGYLADEGFTAVTAIPKFVDMKLGEGPDGERTAIRFTVSASK